jgi:hypothetical protein
VDLPSYKMVIFHSYVAVYQYTTYKNGDDWGMVQMALSLPTFSWDLNGISAALWGRYLCHHKYGYLINPAWLMRSIIIQALGIQL